MILSAGPFWTSPGSRASEGEPWGRVLFNGGIGPRQPSEGLKYIFNCWKKGSSPTGRDWVLVQKPRLLHLATVGSDPEPVLIQMRDYPVSKLILLTTKKDHRTAAGVKKTIEPLNVPVDIYLLEGDDVLMETLNVVGEVVANEGKTYDDVILNVSSGEKMLTCSALSAAFVNGVKAIGIMDGSPFQLPVLKFSYTELVSQPKRRILEALEKVGGEVDSLNHLAELAEMEKSLLSYHVRGGRDSKGLQPLGLVAVERGQQGRLSISLTEMGKIMLIGRVLRDDEEEGEVAVENLPR